jgi:isopentenyldiphosphate isomerase
MGALLAVCSSEKAVQRRVREELGVERLKKAVSHLAAGLTKDWGEHLVDMIQAS